MGNTMRDTGLQRTIFEGVIPLKITKPLRLIELFAGIGAQAKALENLGVQFEHYRICEFDKYAVASYNAVHGTNFATSDITKIHAEELGIVDTDKYEYIMTYSFPCTDLSKAGKQQGMSRESGTRSGLLWEVERLLKEAKQLPQILLMENVPDILSEKNRKDFYSWCCFLEKLGYTSKYAILNSKNYGVPQNRERCFMLSWLGNEFYYDFPERLPLKKKLAGFLEKKVDEKYYISEKSVSKLKPTPDVNEQVSKTVRTGGRGSFDRHSWDIVAVKPIALDEQNGYLRKDGTVGTITTDGSSPKHNNRIVEIIENRDVRLFQYGHGYLPPGEINSDVFPTVRESNTARYNNAIQQNGDVQVRKLTPKECWRLMGFDDESFSRAEKVVSNSQLYKQAGNSIVVDVLMAIFKKLF